MAAPCLANGNCTTFYMDGTSLRVDLAIDPDTDNAAVCNVDGLFVPRSRARYVEGTSNTPMAFDGLTLSLSGLRIAVDDFTADASTGVNNLITEARSITYTNTTGLPEMCRFEFVMGQTQFDLRAGWQFDVGLKTSWAGPAALAPVTGLFSSVGLQTGLSAFNQAWDGTASADPAGVTVPPYFLPQMTVIEPGETLTLTWRLYAFYLALGLPDDGSSQGQAVNITFGSLARIMTWTQG